MKMTLTKINNSEWSLSLNKSRSSYSEQIKYIQHFLFLNKKVISIISHQQNPLYQ